MTPAQFLSRIKQAPPPAVLLLGPEAYQRRRIKDALQATVPETAVTQHDLCHVSLAEVLDDARALSLFASERLIWVCSAEAALPAVRSGGAEPEGESVNSHDSALLAADLKHPTP